ncbi:hypothetical protein GCM10027076_08210 [Nocardioides montaniterrae]
MVLGILALVVVLAGSGITAFLLLHDDTATTPKARATPAAAPAPIRSIAPPVVSSATPTTVPPLAATTAPTPTTAVATPAGFRCWDGASRTSLGACGWPAAVSGLHWTFPVLGAACRWNRPAGRSASAWCDHDTVHYSMWNGRAAMVGHYRAAHPEAVTAPGPGLFAWHIDATEPGTYKVVVMYDEPGSLADVTIYAQDQADYLRIERGLHFRAPADLQGVSAGEG